MPTEMARDSAEWRTIEFPIRALHGFTLARREDRSRQAESAVLARLAERRDVLRMTQLPTDSGVAVRRRTAFVRVCGTPLRLT